MPHGYWRRRGHSPRTTSRKEEARDDYEAATHPVPGRAGGYRLGQGTRQSGARTARHGRGELVDIADPGDRRGPSTARTPPILQRPGRHGEPAIGVHNRQHPINVDSPAAFRSVWFKDGGGPSAVCCWGRCSADSAVTGSSTSTATTSTETTPTSATGSANDHILGAIATTCPPAPPPGNTTISCDSIRHPPGRSWQRHQTRRRRQHVRRWWRRHPSTDVPLTTSASSAPTAAIAGHRPNHRLQLRTPIPSPHQPELPGSATPRPSPPGVVHLHANRQKIPHDGRLIRPVEKRHVDPTLVQHRPGNQLFGPRTGHRAHIPGPRSVSQWHVPARSETHSPLSSSCETGLPRFGAG